MKDYRLVWVSQTLNLVDRVLHKYFHLFRLLPKNESAHDIDGQLRDFF